MSLTMLPSYRLFPRILRWFRRFRQRRGYGVHSPFAFEWITDVVYNQQAQYYAYAPLSQQHKQWSGVLSIKDARLLFRMANHCRAKLILMVGQGLERERNYLQAARPTAQIVLLSDNQAVQQHLAQHTNTPPHFDFVLWMATESPSLHVLSHLCAMMTEHPTHLSEHPKETSDIFPKTSDVFQKTSDIFQKTSEIFPKMSDVSDEKTEKATPAVLAPTAVFVLLCPHADESRKQVWQNLQQSAFSTVSFDLHRFGVAFHYPKLQRQHYVVNYF